MPQYLVTVEQEGIAYPFLVDASERGRAIAQIKRHWLEQGWGAYDALHIELMRKDRQGIARPARLTVKTYSRVQALVHHCWLDMHDGQVDRDQVLRQLCVVLTEVLPPSITQEVVEIVGAHERAGQAAFTAAALRPVQLVSARLLAQEALADGAREQEQEQTSDA